MRSQLVFGALLEMPNRYLLCRVTAKAMRKMHRPMSRVQDTINDVFLRAGTTAPIAQAQVLAAPETSPAPAKRFFFRFRHRGWDHPKKSMFEASGLC